MRKVLVLVLLAALALGGVLYGNSLGSHPKDNWPGSNNVGQEPAATLQSFHDTKWIPDPGQASCHSLQYCTVQWTANATYDVAADYIWAGTDTAALAACTGWYNESLLTAVGWACLWQLTYNAWPSFLAFYSQQNVGLVMVWGDSPGMPYLGDW